MDQWDGTTLDEDSLGTMEHCQVCGKAYETVYLVPDEVWKIITPKEGEAGLLCPECADTRARILGIELYWSANEGSYR